jgi:hypothetical protein
MAESVKNTHPIWLFGGKQDFKVYDCGTPLNTFQYLQDDRGPARRQKNQIVLHFTAGNNPATGTLEWWNTCATQYFCPKWPSHDYQQATPGECPLGHGALKHINASSHYVVERAVHRAEPDRPYVDVIEVVDSETVTWHGEWVNTNSIGIEHANVGEGFHLTSDDKFTGSGANKRPTDRNHWLHLGKYSYSGSNLCSHDFQAYEEEQYLAMILLLRFLCIKHRIARRFLGDTTAEKFARWHNRGALVRSRLMRFRGILSHMNCHDTKECGGPALHRNRLFRGIIDEWWLPLQIDGCERGYHMGPFDPQTDTPSFFRWSSGALRAELFHDANIDSLQETKSYFDLDEVEWYFTQTENSTLGGSFPIGTNKIWHGGVHFKPPDSNRKVYAAASGTIVAARLGSDTTIENDPEFGSQRFVLVRHCVYWKQQTDSAGGEQINYAVDPAYFFTLYMHLAPVANIDDVDNNNPPWVNYWRRRNAGASANAVFCPNVPVSVGDWLGECGTYRGQRMLHFEVMSKEEITAAPWNDTSYRLYDTDSNVICDVPAIDKFVKDKLGDGIDTLDVLRAARDLRKVKSYHKSEWSLSDASALVPVLPNTAARNATWNKIKTFMWVADAVAACPDLGTQLCAATGMMWHYHPIAFMEFVNRLILNENGRVSEPDFKDTNVEMQDGFLTHYVKFSSGSRAPAPADNSPVRPFSVSDANFQYHVSRTELACLIPVSSLAHDPADNPPKQTRFHISLLDVVEDIRQSFGGQLAVKLSYVCAAHNTDAHTGFCAAGSETSLASHAAGVAIDIQPRSITLESARRLWTEANAAAGRFQANCGDYSGAPSHAELRGNVQSIMVTTEAGARNSLATGKPLTPAQLHNFTIHLELVERARTVRWLTVIAPGTTAVSATVSNGNIIGNFQTKESADRERARNTAEAWPNGYLWQCVVKVRSRATQADVGMSLLVGYYDALADAEAESTSGSPWPQEY